MNAALLNQGIPAGAAESDTIVVELHDAMSPTTVISSSKTVIQTDGTALFTFPSSVVGQNAYIVVLHRSALQTWSKLPITMASTTTYNFTTGAAQAFGDNMKEMEPGVWAMYSGDLNQDEFMDLFDQIEVDNDLFGGLSGYYRSDLTGDGFIDLFDQIILDNNLFVGVGVVKP